MQFDSTGFTGKSLLEYREDIQNEQIRDIEARFKYQPDKIIHQLNTIYALKASEISQLVEKLQASLYLDSAEGVWLEGLALLRGVSKDPLSASFTTSQLVVLSPTTTIPANSTFSSSTIDVEATNPSIITPNVGSAQLIEIEFSEDIDFDLPETTYGITINGEFLIINNDLQQYEDLAQVVADEINIVVPGVTATQETRDGMVLVILEPDEGTTVSFSSITSRISVYSVGTLASLVLTEQGRVEVPELTIDTLDNPPAGFFSTINPRPFVTGTNKEGDTELRAKIARGPSIVGGATVGGVEASLEDNVAGVRLATVEEGSGTIEVLVVGGTDEDVAQELWRVHGAGIPTTGNTTVAFTDQKNKPRSVNFTRPTGQQVAIRVDYEVNAEEEPLDNAGALIEYTVNKTIDALELGGDVIPTRFSRAIYNAAPTGISIIEVTAQIPPSGIIDDNIWSNQPISIPSTQFATTNNSLIQVNLV